MDSSFLAFASVAAWTAITITITFLVIKAIIGLRVTAKEEIIGLDKLEHGIDSGYAGFSLGYSAEEVAEANEAGIDLAGGKDYSSCSLLHQILLLQRQIFLHTRLLLLQDRANSTSLRLQ